MGLSPEVEETASEVTNKLLCYVKTSYIGQQRTNITYNLLVKQSACLLCQAASQLDGE